MPDEPSVLGLLVASVDKIGKEQAAGFSALNAKLDTKANKADLDALAHTLDRNHDDHDKRLDKLEAAEAARRVAASVREHDGDKRRLTRGQLGAVSLGVATLAATWVLAIVALLHP